MVLENGLISEEGRYDVLVSDVECLSYIYVLGPGSLKARC